ncbi:MAG: hypothetical protein AB8I08_28910 [Sandaracinaceae bacterium]
MRRLTSMLLILTALGCATDPATSDAGRDARVSADAGSVDAGSVDAGTSCAAVEPSVVTLTTDDGVALEADYYASGVDDGAGVVLLHMIPPGNTRANYPRAFIDTLTGQCMSVLNVDRRGAGGSAGVAAEAYTGPNGVLDARAAIAYLTARSVAPARLAIVGASNGTTTLLDYVALSGGDATLPTLAAAVLLSGGSYTENQTTLTASGLSAIPSLFAYPVAEAAWNDTQGAMVNDLWSFREYDPGSHGTRLFDSAPPSIEHVSAFLLAHTAE